MKWTDVLQAGQCVGLSQPVPLTETDNQPRMPLGWSDILPNDKGELAPIEPKEEMLARHEEYHQRTLKPLIDMLAANRAQLIAELERTRPSRARARAIREECHDQLQEWIYNIEPRAKGESN